MIKKDEVDERATDRCLALLEASFPKSLLQAIFCGSDMVKGTLVSYGASRPVTFF